jgi:hypothetical protein
MFHQFSQNAAWNSTDEAWRWQLRQSSTIHGARAEVLRVKPGIVPGQWMSCLEARAVCNVVIVATATELARIRWGAVKA